MNREQQRFEAAKAAMQGILANGPLCHRIMDGDLSEATDLTEGERVARIALHMADALLSALHPTTEDSSPVPDFLEVPWTCTKCGKETRNKHGYCDSCTGSKVPDSETTT